MNAIFSFLAPCVFIAVTCVPLMLGVVPPNRFYGFRTAKTLANRELWFRANRFAGWALFIAAGTSAVIFLAQPEYASGRSVLGLVIFVVPIIMAVGASFAYLRSVASGGQK